MFIKILLVLPLLATVGCASVQTPKYNQPSPSIERMKDSGFKPGYQRDPDSVRYEPKTTLEGAVKQAGEVMITVTFDYRSSSRRGGQTRNCKMHIKSSDSSLADVRRCYAEQSGNTFIVSFRSDNRTEKSFDLHSLGGYYDGARPLFFSNSYLSIRLSSNREQKIRYIFVGNDPFGLK